MVSRFTFILLLVAFLNALCFPLITLGLTHVSHMTFATLRAVLAGMVLGVVAIMLRRPIPTDFRSWIALALIGLGATTSAYFGMFHAAEFVSPGLATVIANSQPLIAAALAFAFLSERLRPAQYVGLAIGFLGIVAVTLPQLDIKQGFDGVIGPAFIVLAAAGLAVSNVLMKGVRNRIDPLVAMSAQLLLGAIPLAVMALALERPFQIHFSSDFGFSLIVLALPGTALAYWLWFWVLDRVPLSQANAFTLLTPVFALLLGIGFFGEQFAPSLAFGLVLTAIGLVIVERYGGS
ncbi:transporter [Pseudaminobacter manganicus]|uniref:Transporter n=2 Tax=Manganibacter manganicus TaxID=1873176 RepID=A0A1V8RKJ1_9HYPH|nr:transporter [Pseudaminobacter manganicus]